MLLQSDVANKNPQVCITRVSMATKLGRMIASLNGLLPIMSHDPLITWPCKIRGQHAGGGSASKCLSRHRFLVPLLASVSGRTVESYLELVLRLVIREACDQDLTYSLVTQKIFP